MMGHEVEYYGIRKVRPLVSQSLCGKGETEGYVYFIGCDGVGLIKIGFANTNGLEQRFRAIAAYSPVELTPLGAIRGNLWLERDIHHHFSHLCHHGEWFQDDPAIRSFISKFCSELWIFQDGLPNPCVKRVSANI